MPAWVEISHLSHRVYILTGSHLMMEKWLSASCEEVGGYILGKVRTMNLSCYFCNLLHGLWLILPTHKGKLGNRGYLWKPKFRFSTFWPWHGILWPTYWNASFQVVLSHRDIFQMFFSPCCPALDSMVQLCNCLLAYWTWPCFPFSLHLLTCQSTCPPS